MRARMQRRSRVSPALFKMPILARSHPFAGNEAADVKGVVALADVPDHGFAHRITGIVHARLLRYLQPLAFDRHPVAGAAHFEGGPMAVGDIAARHAVRTAHALEPGPDIVRNVRVLAVVE